MYTHVINSGAPAADPSAAERSAEYETLRCRPAGTGFAGPDYSMYAHDMRLAWFDPGRYDGWCDSENHHGEVWAGPRPPVALCLFASGHTARMLAPCELSATTTPPAQSRCRSRAAARAKARAVRSRRTLRAVTDRGGARAGRSSRTGWRR